MCYSLHSSFSEIIDVLQTLKPKRCTPIAAPLATLMTTKRLFQLIDYFIQDKKQQRLQTSMVAIKSLYEKMQKKPVNQQIQLKHRYESFETKLERKRRRKLFKQRQQRKANDEELDFGIDDEKEHNLLRRINDINESIGKLIQTNSSKNFYRCTY